MSTRSGVICFDQPQRAFAIGGDQRGKAGVVERVGEKTQGLGRVVHDQDGVAAHVGCVGG
jgi:hypothetical protein